MSALRTTSTWPQHPLGGALLRFDRLPSHWLHAEQLAALFPPLVQTALSAAVPESTAWQRWHRHSSQWLARTLDLAPVSGLDAVGLPLALLPRDRWNELQCWSGALLAIAPLRQLIERAAVQSVRAQLGSAFDFVRSAEAMALYSGYPDLPSPDLPRALDWCSNTGASLVLRALEATDPAVAARARLRLPPASTTRPTHALNELAPAKALQLAYSLVERIHPSWLSSFPATR